MKPKDGMFPTFGERFRLQLREVVSDSNSQHGWIRSETHRDFAPRAGSFDPMNARSGERAATRH